MNTQAEIKWITTVLEECNDPGIVSYIKNLLLSLQEKPESKRFSIEEYNKALEKAEAQIKAGEYMTIEELRDTQKLELDRRLKMHENDDMKYSSWDEVRQRVRDQVDKK